MKEHSARYIRNKSEEELMLGINNHEQIIRNINSIPKYEKKWTGLIKRFKIYGKENIFDSSIELIIHALLEKFIDLIIQQNAKFKNLDQYLIFFDKYSSLFPAYKNILKNKLINETSFFNNLKESTNYDKSKLKSIVKIFDKEIKNNILNDYIKYELIYFNKNFDCININDNSINILEVKKNKPFNLLDVISYHSRNLLSLNKKMDKNNIFDVNLEAIIKFNMISKEKIKENLNFLDNERFDLMDLFKTIVIKLKFLKKNNTNNCDKVIINLDNSRNLIKIKNGDPFILAFVRPAKKKLLMDRILQKDLLEIKRIIQDLKKN